MKKICLFATLTLVSACAAPQPIPMCNYDPDQPRIQQRACQDDGDRGHSRSEPRGDDRDREAPSPGNPGSSGPRVSNDPPANDPPANDPPANDPPANDPPANDGPKNGPKGNASANNGKGGNYDKTGHEDNGKGNGKGRR